MPSPEIRQHPFYNRMLDAALMHDDLLNVDRRDPYTPIGAEYYHVTRELQLDRGQIDACVDAAIEEAKAFKTMKPDQFTKPEDFYV